jgi:hypothetical protein
MNVSIHRHSIRVAYLADSVMHLRRRELRTEKHKNGYGPEGEMDIDSSNREESRVNAASAAVHLSSTHHGG